MIKEFEKIKNCTKCDLAKVRKQVVLGRGSVPADIFFLLGSPNKSENKKLDEVINISGLSDAKIFISNSCLCFVERSNPNPEDEHLLACWDNIKTILEVVKPKYLVPMGNTALYSITGKKEISKCRGKFLKIRPELNNGYTFKIMPSFHPSSIIHDDKKKSKIVEDLAYLNNILYPEKSKLQHILVNNIEMFDKMCGEMYSSGNTVSFDIETTGLLLWKDEIIGLSFSCDWNRGYYLPLLIREDEEDKNSRLISYWNIEDDRVIRKGIFDILSNTKIGKTGQNLPFDRKFCKKWFNTDIKNIVFDAQFAAHLIDENSKTGLGVLALKYPDLVGIKKILGDDLTKKERNAGEFYKAKLSTLVTYGSGDVIAPYRLTHDFYKEISGTKLEDLMFGISLPLSDVIVDMESRGIQVDREYMSQLKIDFTKDLEILKGKIFEISCDEFNLDSTQQLSSILFKKLKLKRGKKTKKSSDDNPTYSTDISVLESLYYDHEIIGEIMKYRTVSKLLSKEVVGLEKLISPEGIVYGSFGITATTSGRLNAYQPNLQNISGLKMDKIDLRLNEYRAKIRPMYVPREGYLFLRADFCVTGDTEIITTMGVLPIRSLPEYPDIGVLSSADGKSLCMKKVIRWLEVGTLPVVEILLEDGSTVKCTSEHKWMTYEGELVKTQDLSVGDRLTHVKESYAGPQKYPTWYIKSNRNYSYKHDLVASYMLGEKPNGYHVDHIDGDIANYNADNFRYLEASENKAQGGKRYWKSVHDGTRSDENRLKNLREGLKHRRSYVGTGNPNYGNHRGETIECITCGGERYKYPSQLPSRFCSAKCYFENKRQNHRIVAITPCGKEPVYQITVEDTHTYVLANGLISGNSQIELRILAWLSQDPAMMKILRSGGDIHSETAREMFGVKEVTEEVRKKAKTMNFAIIYGLSTKEIVIRLGISTSEAVDLKRRYFAKFYRLRPWMNDVVNFMRRNLYTENIFGRRRRFPNYRREEKYVQEANERECINHHPQSISGVIVQLAQIRCHKRFKEAHQLVQVHDELIFEISEDKIFDMKDDIIYEMERQVAPFDIKFPVESVVEKRWSVAV